MRFFKPSNTRKGIRGYASSKSQGVRHRKSSKAGTQKRRTGKQLHMQTDGPLGMSKSTMKRKKRKGLFGLW